MGTQLPLPQKGAQPPIFGPYRLWPNGWMDQDATWYGGRPRPAQYCVTCGPSSNPPRGRAPPVFGPCVLWTNGWMDQDAWYERIPQRRPHCARWGPSSPSPKRGHRPPISAHVCYGQTAGWINMPNGRPSQLLLSTYHGSFMMAITVLLKQFWLAKI